LPSKDFGEDAAFFLYLFPIVASIVYGAYEWAITAKTTSMPPTAYLVVSKDPYLFLASLIAIVSALLLEVSSASIAERNGVIQANTRRLQILAVIVLIISLAAGISAGGYNLADGFSFFINGRYAIIFAFFLVGISFLLTPRQIIGNARLTSLPEVLGLILLVLAPVSYYGGVKIHLPSSAALVLAIIVGLIGLFLIVSGSSLFVKKKQQPTKAVESPAVTTA